MKNIKLIFLINCIWLLMSCGYKTESFATSNNLENQTEFLPFKPLTGFLIKDANNPKLLQAAQVWNEAFGFELFKIIQPNTNERANITARIVYAIALPAPTGCQIIMSEEKQNSLNTWIHELGHCLGLPHNPDGESVMNQLVNEDQSITNEDIENILLRYNNFEN